MIEDGNLKSISIAILITLVWQLPALVWVIQSINNDSFLTLSAMAALGLVVLLAVLLGVIALLNHWRSRKIRKLTALPARLRLLVDLVLAFLLFTVLWGISPQVFYLYYQLVFDGLPAQLVVRDWLPLKSAASLLLPVNIRNTSQLAAGFTLVWMIIHTLLMHGPIRRSASKN